MLTTSVVNNTDNYNPRIYTSPTVIDIPEGVCGMESLKTDPTKEKDDAKKQECLKNIWLALKDRYYNKCKEA